MYDSASFWHLTIVEEDRNCIVPQGYRVGNITDCFIQFSVCKPLPAKDACSNGTNSSTCLVVTTDDNKDHYFNIGNYNAKPDHGFAPIGEQCKDLICCSCSAWHQQLILSTRPCMHCFFCSIKELSPSWNSNKMTFLRVRVQQVLISVCTTAVLNTQNFLQSMGATWCFRHGKALPIN